MHANTIAAALLDRVNVSSIMGEGLVHHDDVDGEYRPFGVVRLDEPEPAKPKKPHHLVTKKKTVTAPPVVVVAT